jgi:mycothione reductase
VFTHPQIATVGLTEQQARQRGHRVSVKTQMYGGTAYGWAMEDEDSFLKVIGDRDTGLVLGAHFLGPDSSSLIQPLIQAMAFATPAHRVARGQYWIHPALAEVVENALLGLEVD